jgi:YD repeat-containing protein
MWAQVACEALQSGQVLELRYDGFSRSVEVHAVGVTKEGNGLMRVWQVSGGSASNEPVGWKLLRLDEASGAVVTHQRSLAPRQGYKRGNPAMRRISCQL